MENNYIINKCFSVRSIGLCGKLTWCLSSNWKTIRRSRIRRPMRSVISCLGSSTTESLGAYEIIHWDSLAVTSSYLISFTSSRWIKHKSIMHDCMVDWPMSMYNLNGWGSFQNSTFLSPHSPAYLRSLVLGVPHILNPAGCEAAAESARSEFHTPSRWWGFPLACGRTP